jgi:replicative DNA helicase
MNNQRSLQANSDYGKVPPSDVEIEESILGALLLEKSAFEKVENILKQGCFYKDAHNKIFDAILELNRKRQPIDLMTVSDQAKKDGSIDEIGGTFYLMGLTSKIGSSAHIEQHSYILLEKYIRRELIATQSEISNAAYDESQDLENVIALASKRLDKIDEISNGSLDSQHIRDIAHKCIKSLDERTSMTQEGKTIGVPTGFVKLDEATAGWQPGELIVVAARPGVGKTALALFHARKAAKESKSVCIYSLEMTSMSLTDRMIVAVADIDSNRYKTGKLHDYEYEKLNNAISGIENMNIYIDDNPSVSMKYIRSHARKMKKKGKCDMIIIDYLQLINMDGSFNQTREQLVAKASRDAKIIAKEVNIPVMLLAQLSRAVEQRAGDKRPILSDLRESGAIEQDADMVMFIHRPNYYGITHDGEDNDISNMGMYIIAKFRNGTPQDIKFKHNKSLTRFVGEGEELNDSLPF